ncbi:MAG: AAA family ATPase, partial [Limnobacter sp.]|nr:AAA family ATPase [Limnobacter sp.]
MVGQAKRREYTIMGDAVNLSARLMQEARNLSSGLPVLMDEATAQACQSQFALNAVGQVQLKGKAACVKLYQPVARLGSQNENLPTPSLFVGRHQELDILKHALQPAEPGQPKALLIQAPVGMGRSSLIQQALLNNPLVQQVIQHRCDALDTQLPWAAWQKPFQQLFNTGQCTNAQQIRQQVTMALKATDELRWAPLLEAVLPAQWEDNEHTAALTGEPRATATLELLVRLVVYFDSTTPVQWVFYGIEWMDKSSVNLLTRLLDQPLRYPVILTTQTETLSSQQDISTVKQHPLTRTLPLPALTQQQVLSLSANRAGASHLPEQAGQLILERAGGSPLFTIQATDALLEAKYLQLEQGELVWHPPQAGIQSALPASMNGLILSRIEKLAPDIQLTGKVASIMGHEARFDHIEILHPMQCTKPVLNQHHHSLAARGLVKPSDSSTNPKSSLVFSNEAIERGFYGLLPGFQRRALHQKLATLLDSELDLDNPLHQAQLAHHWHQAVEPGRLTATSDSFEAAQKACTLYLQLANRAIALGASTEAQAGFQTVLSLLAHCEGDTLEALEVDALLGLSTVRSTRFGWGDKQAEQALAAALQKSTSALHALKVFQAVRGLWQVKVANSDYKSAMTLAQELFDRAREIKQPGEVGPMIAEAKRALGTTYFWIGQFEPSQRLLNEALSMSNQQSAGPSQAVTLAQDTEVSARGILAWAYALLGQEELALEQARQAVEVSDRLDSEFTRAYARGAAMWTCLHVSDVTQALHFADLTLQLSREKGYHYFTTAALVVGGWAKAWQGDEAGIDDIAKAISDWAEAGQTIGM